jgi:hypothetical protein
MARWTAAKKLQKPDRKADGIHVIATTRSSSVRLFATRFSLYRPVARRHNRTVQGFDAAIPAPSILENQGDGLADEIIELEIASLTKSGEWIVPSLEAGLLNPDRIEDFPDFDSSQQDLAYTFQFFRHSSHGLTPLLCSLNGLTNLPVSFQHHNAAPQCV